MKNNLVFTINWLLF